MTSSDRPGNNTKTVGNVASDSGAAADGDHSIVDKAGRWAGLIAVICFAMIAWVGHVRYAPPVPLPIDADARQFSAQRAMLILRELIGDEIPHPAGSEQNDIVRERILAMVRKWGYEPLVQSTSNHMFRRPDLEEVPLENIMFRKPGRDSNELSGDAILLVAHYDSRPEGPGASDDGVGMAAVLEIARMMANEPAPEREVMFLITDGEEFGLLGADKWCQEHPWAKQVGIAINLEARGTTGGSLMFETSAESQWLIKRFARATARPLTSSLFYEIYKSLPNDTDFTMLKAAGISGYNFGYIGEVRNYHTPQDNVENIDRGTLQHHGQNTLSLVREFSKAEQESHPSGRAVFFDFFATAVVWWPAGWSLWLSVGMMVLTAVAFVRLPGKVRPSFRGLAIGIVAIFLVLVAVVTVGYGVGTALRLDPRLELRWLDHPLPVELTYWFSALAVLAFLVNAIKPLQDTRTMLIVVGAGWCLLALLTSVYLNGASYLFIIPAAGFAMAALACSRDGAVWGAALLAALVGGLFWVPLERLLYDALGFMSPVLLAARVAVSIVVLLPVVSASGRGRILFGWLAVAGFIVSALAAVWLHQAG